MTVTTGIELELWVVDQDGCLCDGRQIADEHERIKPEFVGPLLEVQTEPCGSEAALRRDLQETLRTAIRAAHAGGNLLVPLGTPLTEADVACHDERGKLFEQIYGGGVKSAKNCAGTHVHFERGETVRQLNLLTALDPALALTSSSPYYCGQRGRSSSRAHAYRKQCGPEFRQFCDLWEYTDSVEEWQQRVDSAYEAFKSIAEDRGVSAATVEEYFEPENTVLNPVRLRRCQPTVEWRAPDAALPSEVVRLATDVAELVEQTEHKPVEVGRPGVFDDRIGVPEFDELYDLSRVAINFGLRPTPVQNYLRRMGFDSSAYRPLSLRLGGAGTLTETEACQLRLEQAHRFEADVAKLTAPHPPTANPVEEA
ncbi:glutamate-cysteine ligase family protein [Halobacterium wangiae]|uniref:glutamate-cysteine ligase family protein n=1 Tax=Halobacterium wangiae TaxID=2902623 RepID=UPI001E4FB86A|nr:glutamate-cysteine ligase family protein [Halobacterium wangiae]